MGLPTFDMQRPFDAGLWCIAGAAVCFLLTSLYTWHILPQLTIVVFFDIVGNLLVILGCVLNFESPNATGSAVTLGGGALWFFEIVLLWKSYQASGTMFLLLLGTLCFGAAFVFLTLYHRTTSQNNVDNPTPYLMLASGILAGLAVLATMFRTHIRITYLIRLFGDGLLAYAGYVWIYFAKGPVAYVPPAAPPSREYV